MARRGGIENRRYKRINKLIAVNIIRFKDKKTLPKLDEEIGFNISVGGILIECSKRLPKEAPLKMKLMLPMDSKFSILKVPCRVVWSKRSFRDTYYVGCRFTRLSPRAKNILRKFTRS